MGTTLFNGTRLYSLVDVEHFKISMQSEVTIRHYVEKGWWDQVSLRRDSSDCVRVTCTNDRGETITSEVDLRAKTVRLMKDYPRGFPLEWETMKPLREVKRLLPAAHGETVACARSWAPESKRQEIRSATAPSAN